MAKKSGLEQMVRGLLVGGAAYGLWVTQLVGWWIIPVGVLFGLFPFIGGITRSIRTIEQRKQERHEALIGKSTDEKTRKDGLDKAVLKVARKKGGVVTPTTIVLETDLKLEEAEQVLQGLAARGYAEMRVRDNGTIDYVFHGLE